MKIGRLRRRVSICRSVAVRSEDFGPSHKPTTEEVARPWCERLATTGADAMAASAEFAGQVDKYRMRWTEAIHTGMLLIDKGVVKEIIAIGPDDLGIHYMTVSAKLGHVNVE